MICRGFTAAKPDCVSKATVYQLLCGPPPVGAALPLNCFAVRRLSAAGREANYLAFKQVLMKVLRFSPERVCLVAWALQSFMRC